MRESYNIDNLTPEAEVMFYRLMTYADDFGLFKADPRLVNRALFPLKNYKDESIVKWFNQMAENDLVEFYVIENKYFGRFKKWSDHQNCRNKKSKYPEPKGELLKSIEINCYQLKSVDPPKESNPIQSNPIQSNPLFDEFWLKYPKKIAKAKCRDKYNQLSRSDQEEAIEGVIRYSKYWQINQTESKFIPHPITWLNQERWCDELPLDEPDQLEANQKKENERLMSGWKKREEEAIPMDEARKILSGAIK